MAGANICLIQVLYAAAEYLGFNDIDAELDGIFETMKAPAPPTIVPPRE